MLAAMRAAAAGAWLLLAAAAEEDEEVDLLLADAAVAGSTLGDGHDARNATHAHVTHATAVSVLSCRQRQLLMAGPHVRVWCVGVGMRRVYQL
jgi:hypothetical protein